MKIIGLAGTAGSGKSTAARILTNRHLVKIDGMLHDVRRLMKAAGGGERLHNENGIELALSDPMKSFAMQCFGFSVEQLWGESAFRNAADMRWQRPDGTYLTPREALQSLGTSWGRSMHPDIWINQITDLASTIGKMTDTKLVVISDLRFLNEAKYLRDNSHEVWLIERKDSGLRGDAGLHESEKELGLPEFKKYVTQTIDNNGTIEELTALMLETFHSTKKSGFKF